MFANSLANYYFVLSLELIKFEEVIMVVLMFHRRVYPIIKWNRATKCKEKPTTAKHCFRKEETNISVMYCNNVIQYLYIILLYVYIYRNKFSIKKIVRQTMNFFCDYLYIYILFPIFPILYYFYF